MSWKAQRFTKQYRRHVNEEARLKELEEDYFEVCYGCNYHSCDWCDNDDYCCDLHCCKPPSVDDIWRSFLAGLLYKLGIESADEMRFNGYWR